MKLKFLFLTVWEIIRDNLEFSDFLTHLKAATVKGKIYYLNKKSKALARSARCLVIELRCMMTWSCFINNTAWCCLWWEVLHHAWWHCLWVWDGFGTISVNTSNQNKPGKHLDIILEQTCDCLWTERETQGALISQWRAAAFSWYSIFPPLALYLIASTQT